MRISDWSSDVCSSDLLQTRALREDVVVLGEAVALADEGAGGPAALQHAGPFQAVIDARARIDAVTPGKTVQLEQVGIVELEIEAVLVGYLAGVGTVGRDHRLHCRLEIGRAHV